MQTTNQQAVPYKFVTLNADTLTPIGIFMKLSGSKKFLLESTFHHEQKGKFSFIGADPYEEIIGHGKTTKIINYHTGEKKSSTIDALQYMKKHLPKLTIDIPLPFSGGAVGYVGYDAAFQYENIGEALPDEMQMPDIHFMVYQDVFVFDHEKEIVYLLAINVANQSEANLDERIKNMKNILTENTFTNEATSTSINFIPQQTAATFKNKLEQAKKHIEDGDILQIVLSQRMQANLTGDPFPLYRNLRRKNPSPYMFYLDFSDYIILGTSPESLIQLQGDKLITNPIAGTRPRGKTTKEDAQLSSELINDEKEIAEHKMLVDLSRNDLGRVCSVGSITISEFMKIEKYQHVMHLVSEVHGKLKPELTNMDALIACLPAGTVTGAPKIRAMQLINQLEGKKRGVYGGGIGYIGYNQDLNMALAIRTMVIKDNLAFLQTGAGIVYDSIPQQEYAETMHKAKAIMEVKNNDFVN